MGCLMNGNVPHLTIHKQKNHPRHFMTLLAHKSFSQPELRDICNPTTHQLSMTH